MFLLRRRGMGHFVAVGLGVIGAGGLILFVRPVLAEGLVSTAQAMQSGNQQVFAQTEFAQYTSAASCTEAGGTWDPADSICR